MRSRSLPIISDRREGVEPRRRDCNAIAARLKSAITHTHTLHTPPRRAHGTHAGVGAEHRLCGAATRERHTRERVAVAAGGGTTGAVFMGSSTFSY